MVEEIRICKIIWGARDLNICEVQNEPPKTHILVEKWTKVIRLLGLNLAEFRES